MTKIYVETHGCTLNQSETEWLTSTLQNYEFVTSPERADLLIVNTCAVVEPTEKKMLKRIRSLYSRCYTNQDLIVTGCARKPLYSILTSNFPKAILMTNEQIPAFVRSSYKPSARVNKNARVTAAVKIADGCNGSCTYCIVRLIRGRLKSRGIDRILHDVELRLQRGVKQILITAQDVGAYGLDLESGLPELISAITHLNYDFKVRIGMINPSSISGIVDELIDAYNAPCVYKFAHLPVQSGSDKILELMGRNYTIEEFKTTVAKFRMAFNDLTLSTDFIVGFPYETVDDFKLTLDLLRHLKPLKVNITRFSRRKGTRAYDMPQILERTVKERSRILTSQHHEIAYGENRKWLGTKFRALAVEKGKGCSTILYNDSYRPIVVPETLKLGKTYDVVISDVRPTYLIGRL